MATKVRHIRVPDDVWKAAGARAWAEHTTASAVVVEALREYGAGAVVAPARRPESPPRSPALRPEPVYAGEDDAPCRHPSGLIQDDGTCGECGNEVWLP